MNEIEKFTVNTVEAIWELVRSGHYTQALIIIYSAIDTLAWSSRSSGDLTRSDFCSWVDTYIRPETQLECTADDLYAARCALVHSASAESRMSRDGQASEIWYVTSPNSIPALRAYAQKTGSTAKIVYFTNLLAAYVDAASRFSDDVSTDVVKQQSVNERIRRWLRFVPASFVQADKPEK